MRPYLLALLFKANYRALDAFFGQQGSFRSVGDFASSLLGDSVTSVILLALVTIYGLFPCLLHLLGPLAYLLLLSSISSAGLNLYKYHHGLRLE